MEHPRSLQSRLVTERGPGCRSGRGARGPSGETQCARVCCFPLAGEGEWRSDFHTNSVEKKEHGKRHQISVNTKLRAKWILYCFP